MPALFYTATSFTIMEEINILDINTDVHIFALQYVYLPRINSSLSQFQEAWNSHPLSSASTLSPHQLWIAGSHPNDSEIDVSRNNKLFFDWSKFHSNIRLPCLYTTGIAILITLASSYSY